MKGYRRAEEEAEEGGQRKPGKAGKSTNITLRNWASLCRLAFLLRVFTLKSTIVLVKSADFLGEEKDIK